MRFFDIFKRGRPAAGNDAGRNEAARPPMPEIGVTVHPPTGNGPPVVELSHTITRIGLANLAAISEHRIERQFGSVSHYVRFGNGGALCLAYTLNGDLLEFTWENLMLTFAVDGSVTLDLPRPPMEENRS